MISTVCFLPRGCMNENPQQYELHSEEINELVQRQAGLTLEEAKNRALKKNSKQNEENEDNQEEDEAVEENKENSTSMGNSSEDSSDEDLAVAGKPNATEDELLAELNMEEYENEPEGAELFLGGKSLAVFDANNEDPFITIPDEEDELSDEEDITINKTDALIICGRSESHREDSGEPQSSIEFHIYDEM